MFIIILFILPIFIFNSSPFPTTFWELLFYFLTYSWKYLLSMDPIQNLTNSNLTLWLLFISFPSTFVATLLTPGSIGVILSILRCWSSFPRTFKECKWTSGVVKLNFNWSGIGPKEDGQGSSERKVPFWWSPEKLFFSLIRVSVHLIKSLIDASKIGWFYDNISCAFCVSHIASRTLKIFNNMKSFCRSA